mgnify:FL=1
MSLLSYAAPELGVPLEAGANAAKGILGEKRYKQKRSTLTWTFGALNGFSPIPPMIPLLPVKIALFIVILIICLASGMGGKSIVAAYLGQALLIMFFSEWFLDKFLSWGLNA